MSEPATESVDSGGTTAVAAACAIGVGLVALAAWLAEESEADKALKERNREERARRSLHAPTYTRRSERSISSVELHLLDEKTLLGTAERMGFQRVQAPAVGEGDHTILLRSTDGKRVALQRSNDGRVTLRTGGDTQRLRDIVREHSADRIEAHFRERGMRVERARLSNGEVQMIAHAGETAPIPRAEVRAQVRKDGTTWLDVDKVHGSRCTELVQGVADAIGGSVTGMRKKESFFELPGEPTKTKVKV